MTQYADRIAFATNTLPAEDIDPKKHSAEQILRTKLQCSGRALRSLHVGATIATGGGIIVNQS